MKAYGIILQVGLKGNPIELCGSDALVQLDGRCSLDTHFNTMMDEMKKKRSLHKSICGFHIYMGEFSLKETEIIKKYIDKDVVMEYKEKYQSQWDAFKATRS